MSSNIVAITLDNFQDIIIEGSKSKLVLVAFWAEQIAESITLKDSLTAKVMPFSEYIILATVDCQTQQQIAQQFGIQGLPTAILVKDGQPIDGLSGPQTDEQIEEFLNKHLPKAQDLLLEQAKGYLTENNLADAQTAIIQAHQLDTERADIKLVLADIYIQTGKVADAQHLLDSVLMVDQDSYYQALIAKLELANEAANSPEIQALEAELAKNPNDISIKHQLGAQYCQVNRHEDALALFFTLVQQDGSDTKSRELLLDVLKALPDGDALAKKYRRKLYTLMY